VTRSRAALDLQLAMLAGSAPASAFFEVRALDPARARSPRQEFFPVRDRGAAADAVRALAPDRDTYLGALPRSRREGDASAVEAAYCLWADLDTEAAAAALARFRPEPTMLIATGTPGHAHAYWQLSRPLPAGEVERATRRLAHALGADTACTDRARVLRACSGFNHKTDPPREVRCVLLEPERACRVEQLVGALPDPPRPAPPAASVRRVRDAGADPLRWIPAAVYVERLTGVVVPASGMLNCPLPGHKDRTPSLHAGGPDPTLWRCFGCEKSGDLYALAGALAGFPLPLRGRDFTQAREVALAVFGGAP